MNDVSLGLSRSRQSTALERDGFAIVAEAVPVARLEVLLAAVASHIDSERRGGRRNLFDIPAITDLARDPALREAASAVLGPECFAVRAIFFDKTPSTNWKVAWHQDLTIAVAERREVPGFGPWSVKGGVIHVQPTREILERMVAVRVHLDPCSADNGPVRVLPGSHRQGKLGAEAIDRYREGAAEIACVVPRGGLLVMRPLLLHASSPAVLPDHRRVIHFEFAAGSLPGGLAWRWRV